MINSEILFLSQHFFGDYNAVTTSKLKHDFFQSTNGDKAFEVSLKDKSKKYRYNP